MQEWFAAGAFGISIAAYAPYILSVVQNKSRPKKVTWFVWALVDAIIAYAMYSQGEDISQMLAYLLGASSIFLLTIWYGEPGWTREDKIVLAGSLIAVCFWFFTEANVAIGISLIAVTIGTYPTIKMIWDDPSKDEWFPWSMWLLGGILQVLSIKEHSIAASLGPFGFLVLQIGMVVAFMRQPIMKLIQNKA